MNIIVTSFLLHGLQKMIVCDFKVETIFLLILGILEIRILLVTMVYVSNRIENRYFDYDLLHVLV